PPVKEEKETEKPSEKTQEEKIKEEINKILEDKELSEQIKNSLNKNRTSFEKLFDFRTEDQKKSDKFVEELTNAIKDQNKSNQILQLFEKDKDIFNKLIGKDEKQPEVPAEDNKEDKKQPETPAEDNKEDKKQPETPETPSENGKKTVTEADIDAYIEKMEKDNYILPIKDRNKSVTGPILERTEYKDVKIRDKNGNITTVRVKYLTGLSEESWKLVNEHRRAHGLPEVQAPSRTLQEAANIRAAELYYNYKTYGPSHPNHFAHVRPDGRDIKTSMNNFGGENILHGYNYNLNDDYDAAKQTFETFKNSDGHNKNMLWNNPNKKPIAQERSLAIATIVSEDDPNHVFQVQLFGSSIWGDENHSLLNPGENIKHNDNSVEPIYNKDGSEEYARKKHEENKRKGVRQYLETGEWPEVKTKTENQVDNAKEEFQKNEEERKKAAEKAKEENEKKINDARKKAEEEYAKKQKELAEQLAREEEENRKRIQDEVGTDPSKDNNKPKDNQN
ncbi:MAG: CAP domain-containing protein, partial [Peptoniphilus harei]|nr:CAP domain-containing protein [Peptoniphilus harei]